MLCNVSIVATGPSRVEVQWWQKKWDLNGKGDKPRAPAASSILATLTYDGISRIYTDESELSVDRISAGTYRLRIFSAHEDDQGDYQCQVVVWTQDSHGSWYKTDARAKSNTAHVYLYARGKFKEVCDSVSLYLSFPVSYSLLDFLLIFRWA